jgi:hypothetical protein
VRDQTAWEAFWAEHKSHTSEPGTPPAVDFTQETVVVVFVGQKPSGGYAVEVVNVTWNYNEVFVHPVATQPGPECATASVVTQPFQIVAILTRYEGIGSRPEDAYGVWKVETRTHSCA